MDFNYSASTSDFMNCKTHTHTHIHMNTNPVFLIGGASEKEKLNDNELWNLFMLQAYGYAKNIIYAEKWHSSVNKLKP